MDINWTFIISTCITSAFSSATTFLTMRYLGRMVEHVEKKTVKQNKEDGPGNS